MKQKIYILIITLTISALLTSASFAAKNAKIGSIDMSVENKVKVCKDPTCTKPAPGIIDFEISDGSPLVVDTENGLSGKVWGDELGWITFNPPYGGVFMVDTETGLLQGTAWSKNSGAINFSVTGQKVVIDPKTGEWNGWAWASGPYGGWIKFDCKNASCVHTTWSGQTSLDTQPPTELSPNFNLGERIKDVAQEKIKIMGDNFDIFITESVDLFNKMTAIKSRMFDKAGNNYYTFSSNLIDLRTSVLDGLNNLIK